MATVPVDDALGMIGLWPEETEDAILARWRAWANEGLSPENSEEWVSTREGDMWFIATAPGRRESARLYDLIGSEFLAAGIVLWSWGTYLDGHATGLGVERDAAQAATGELTFVGDVGTDVPAGTTVAAEPSTSSDPVPEYATLEDATIADELGAPTGLSGVAAAGGGLPNATTFHYVVSTVNTEGESTPSGEDAELTANPNLSIDLDWDDVVGATGYRVYRGAGMGGPYFLLAEVTDSEYTDDASDAPGTDEPPAEDTTGGRVTIGAEAVSAGAAGNSPALSVSVLRTSVPGITQVFNVEPMGNGADEETDEALRDKLLARFDGSGPGNAADYEAWVRALGIYGQITVVPLWDGAGSVLVAVMGADGSPLPGDEVDRIQAFLDPVAGMAKGQAPVSATVTVETGVFVDIDVAAVVECEVGYSLDGDGATIAVRAAIVAALTDYVESVRPGDEIVLAQVAARIVSVPGVHDVSGVEIEGAAVNFALDAEPPQIAHLNVPALT